MTAVHDHHGQALEALHLANDTRLCVAAFKREIKDLPHHEAVLAVIDAIENRHEEKLLGAARVRHLLMSIRRIGDCKARGLLMVAQVYNADKRLRDLTVRQRKLLIEILESSGWRMS